jgi:VWFA-related protein
MGAPPAPIARQEVRRTILVVVDDLGLSVVGIDNIRRGLRGFVDTGLLPTDLVAIVRTGESRGILQSLTNDRAALHAAIDALRYNVLSRKGVWPSGDVDQVGPGVPGVEDVPGLRASVSAADSIAALGLAVQGAHDLPGRKTVIFASEGFQLMAGTDGSTQPDIDPRIRSRVDGVIDQATRSGVVIYAIDCRALQTGGMRASDDIHSVDVTGDPDAMGTVVRNLASARLRANRDAQESLAYLSEQTGGFAVLNTNDLAGGLARISNDVRDYYVIGYEPDPDTFAPPGKTPRLHKIRVNVKRPGVTIKARKEFIGLSDPERPSGPLNAGAAARSRRLLAVQRDLSRAARDQPSRIRTWTRPVRPQRAARRRACARVFHGRQRHQEGVCGSGVPDLQQRRRAGRHRNYRFRHRGGKHRGGPGD